MQSAHRAWRPVVGAALVAVLGVACSTGPTKAEREAKARTAAACQAYAGLAASGRQLSKVDVGDPEAFAAAMTTATSDYVRALDRISAAVPATLQPKVANLVRLVQARSFSAALAARHPIDSWAATNC